MCRQITQLINVILSQLLLLFIKLYQFAISPWLKSRCCFYPSCSQYAVESLKRYSFLKASFLIIKRISRCHPLSQCGVDPVP